MRQLIFVLFLATTSACQCGGSSVLVRSPGPDTDGGVGGGAMAGGGTGAGGGVPAGWCASDCDCPAGQACVSDSTGELTSTSCQPGMSTCTQTCPQGCAAGLICVGGSCQTQPCVGTNCTSTFATSVAGTYKTYYELDIHSFAQQAADIGTLLNILNAVFSGQGANCSNQTTLEGKLLCIVVDVIAMNIHAPPWVSQLISVLSDMFKFGDKPIKARGVMTLAEQGTALYAAETWSEMWMDYNGQTINVINSPQLGQNGNITVTVKAFGGVRNATEVVLGPREVQFDVNKLLVNLINVAITAASNNQAHDVGELLDLLLCSNIPISNSNYLVCTAAAQQLAQNFQLDSGLGGVTITQQRATIYDLDNNNIADALGLPSARGTVTGDMSNGIVSGSLGAFPLSNWYGTK